MEKQIGFRRNIYLSWLDATAAMCSETSDVVELRARLNPIVAEHVQSKENRQVAIGMLLNIWVKAEDRHPDLRSEAVALFAQSSVATDRIWLHYGLTLLAYEFFRLGIVTIGQLCRYSDGITPKEIKKRMIAEVGQLGGLDKAVDRIVSSLRDWGVLTDTTQRYTYTPPSRRLTTTNQAIERWLLQVALAAHPAQDLPFADLVRLPELFPFRFTLSVDDLRQAARFEVHRQGMAWDMVRLAG
ncbi:MAG: hypothetical protein ACJ8CR_10155 [Roseiflexaceae bacterium]